jgi:hypothetical protein
VDEELLSHFLSSDVDQVEVVHVDVDQVEVLQEPDDSHFQSYLLGDLSQLGQSSQVTHHQPQPPPPPPHHHHQDATTIVIIQVLLKFQLLTVIVLDHIFNHVINPDEFIEATVGSDEFQLNTTQVMVLQL